MIHDHRRTLSPRKQGSPKYVSANPPASAKGSSSEHCRVWMLMSVCVRVYVYVYIYIPICIHVYILMYACVCVWLLVVGRGAQQHAAKELNLRDQSHQAGIRGT